MYPNLDAELSRKGLKRKDLAPLFKNRIPSVTEKLNGKYPLSLEEAFEIRNQFFPEHKVDYLFDKVAQ
ncbi:MAG: XRE family transcriptional regulator [Solibacillus sp.]